MTYTDGQVERQKKWIAELLTDKYPQGKGALCKRRLQNLTQIDDYFEYCCLGVYEVNSLLPVSPSMLAAAGRGSLTTQEMMEIGLTSEQQHYLVGLNDGKPVEKFVGDYTYKEEVNIEEVNIRALSAPARDFKFIARFLELMFGVNLISGETDGQEV